MESLKIVIVDNRGLTFIGVCDFSETNEQITIKGARCVMQWGTSKHLAELVKGRTENTVLGAAEDVTVFRQNVILTYDVCKDWDTVISS